LWFPGFHQSHLNVIRWVSSLSIVKHFSWWQICWRFHLKCHLSLGTFSAFQEGYLTHRLNEFQMTSRECPLTDNLNDLHYPWIATSIDFAWFAGSIVSVATRFASTFPVVIWPDHADEKNFLNDAKSSRPRLQSWSPRADRFFSLLTRRETWPFDQSDSGCPLLWSAVSRSAESADTDHKPNKKNDKYSAIQSVIFLGCHAIHSSTRKITFETDGILRYMTMLSQRLNGPSSGDWPLQQRV
jgi:hypothetical protein